MNKQILYSRHKDWYFSIASVFSHTNVILSVLYLHKLIMQQKNTI